GRYLIPARPEQVWAALNDPQVLQRCIPGCEHLEKSDPTHFLATATLKAGPVKATFKVGITLSNIDAPRRCTLKGEGQGGAAGFARGTAEVVLTPGAGGTTLSYTANAAIGGRLAQIGQRLIDGTAKQIADDFFVRFREAVASAPAPEASPPPPKPSPAMPESPPAQVLNEARKGLSPAIWVACLLLLIAGLLLFGSVFLLNG
ncbi:MAG TPA: carbon monoxide dehydrogenase subunit G, partial [Rhizomicrobium sp.]|nr:carbon monoxide dehydrogenase subunit G [Rhizomicrobium sp.]